MKALLESIRYPAGRFPRNELQQIIDRREEAIPQLLQMMRELRQDGEQLRHDPSRFDYMFGTYLLAQFRVKEFYPLLVDILSLPENIVEDLFGDAITESMGRILASVYDDNPEPLQRLIENPSVYQYVRGQALSALVALVFNHRIAREFVMDYLKQLLNGKISDEEYYVNAMIVYCCNALYPEEVYEDIKQLYARDAVDTFFIRRQTVNTTLTRSKEHVLGKNQQLTQYKYIDDTIAELQGWAGFQPEPAQTTENHSPVKVKKVGRNEPCPCGSGKKYKKCCGQ